MNLFDSFDPRPDTDNTITPALAEHMSILARHLASAGVANPVPVAAALIFGANATVRHTITAGSGAGVPTAGLARDAQAGRTVPLGPAAVQDAQAGRTVPLGPAAVQDAQAGRTVPLGQNAQAGRTVPLGQRAQAGRAVPLSPATVQHAQAGRAVPISPAGERMPVRRPDGTTTTIPVDHLKTAMQFGYKPITQ